MVIERFTDIADTTMIKLHIWTPITVENVTAQPHHQTHKNQAAVILATK